VTITAGNVTVAFAILSYAGTLTVTVIVDPDAVPDVGVLATALRAELESLTSMAGAPGPPRHATPPHPGADSGHD
jgi:hypothetical protein